MTSVENASVRLPVERPTVTDILVEPNICAFDLLATDVPEIQDVAPQPVDPIRCRIEFVSCSKVDDTKDTRLWKMTANPVKGKL